MVIFTKLGFEIANISLAKTYRWPIVLNTPGTFLIRYIYIYIPNSALLCIIKLSELAYRNDTLLLHDRSAFRQSCAEENIESPSDGAISVIFARQHDLLKTKHDISLL